MASTEVTSRKGGSQSSLNRKRKTFEELEELAGKELSIEPIAYSERWGTSSSNV